MPENTVSVPKPTDTAVTATKHPASAPSPSL